MGLRLLPFRQYDEQDVVNMFALQSDLALAATTDDGQGSNGVFVSISSGNLNSDTISYGTDSYLGKNDYPHLGSTDMYPSNPLTVSGAQSGTLPLGITLNQTAKNDENGEKLLYNATKKEELQAVLPGQSVPVLTKGIVTLHEKGLAGKSNSTDAEFSAAFAIGNYIKVGSLNDPLANKGSITGVVSGTNNANRGGGMTFGTVLATGSRGTESNGHVDAADQFAGRYVVVKFDCGA